VQYKYVAGFEHVRFSLVLDDHSTRPEQAARLPARCPVRELEYAGQGGPILHQLAGRRGATRLFGHTARVGSKLARDPFGSAGRSV
jgi:hypothetical protein